MLKSLCSSLAHCGQFVNHPCVVLRLRTAVETSHKNRNVQTPLQLSPSHNIKRNNTREFLTFPCALPRSAAAFDRIKAKEEDLQKSV